MKFNWKYHYLYYNRIHNNVNTNANVNITININTSVFHEQMVPQMHRPHAAHAAQSLNIKAINNRFSA